jgi:hypothetical protein
MSKIESYTIHMEPFCVGGDNMVDVKVVVNGEIAQIRTVFAKQLPHEAEVEMLHRMGMQMLQGLRDKERHEGCCACCVKKRSCC